MVPGKDIRLCSIPQYKEYPCNDEGDVLISCNLASLMDNTEFSRPPPPVHSFIVLDASDQISKDVLDESISLVERIINELTCRDKLGLLVVGSSAEIRIPLSRMDGTGRRLFSQVLNNIQSQGDTCILHAIEIAIKELATTSKEECRCSILVISSNPKSEVEYQSEDFEERNLTVKNKLLSLGNYTSYITISVAGIRVSSKHSKLFRTISRYGNGKYYDCKNIRNESGCIDVVGCLNGILPTHVRKVQMICSTYSECEIVNILTTYPVHRLNGAKRPIYSIKFGDMYTGHFIDALLLVRLNRYKENVNQKLVKLQVIYEKSKIRGYKTIEEYVSIYRTEGENRSRSIKTITPAFQRATFFSLVDQANRSIYNNENISFENTIEPLLSMLEKAKKKGTLENEEIRNMYAIINYLKDGKSYKPKCFIYHGHKTSVLGMFHQELCKMAERRISA